MSTFALIHGAGDGGWYWHLVEAELQALGHTTCAPDLPSDDAAATLTDYAEVVTDAIAGATDQVIVVGQSFGGFTAPLVVDRLSADRLVFVAGMVPRPGETPDEWWANTGYADAVRARAAVDGGLTGNPDPHVCFFHDVPAHLAQEEMRRERNHPSPAACSQPWPLEALPQVPTKFVLCTEDRFFPAPLMRRVAKDRLGIVSDELSSGHCPALSRPRDLAAILHDFSPTSDQLAAAPQQTTEESPR
jgi:pimeloyl-ACP methyl ester carboxylesterase